MAYSYKGAIAFGLVYIPITLSLGVKEQDIGFHMLDKKTKSRVRYKKTCADCNERELKSEDIVKGYEYEKDKYVLFTDEDFEKIKTAKDKNITISEFVGLGEIDPVYFNKCYYVKPIGASKAFCVLLKAMEAEGKAGIAKTVLGTKETLVVLWAKEGRMLVNTLHFYSEVQKPPLYERAKTSEQEVELAKSLIGQMSGKFQPEKFRDEYHVKLQKAIQRKIAGNEIVEAKEEESPQHVINLMDALKKSIVAEKPKKTRGKNEVKRVSR